MLRNELRVLRTASLDAVADVENHQALIPVAQVGEPVFHIDVVHVVAGFVGPGLPPGHLPRLVRIADVDHPKRAGRVVGQIDVAPVDEGTVHTTGDRLGELRDRLGMRRVLEREYDDPILAGGGVLPGEHAVLAVLGGHHVVDGARVHHHRVGDPRAGRVAHVDGIHPVGDGGQIAVPAVGVKPEFGSAVLDRKPPHEGGRAADIAVADLDRGLGNFSGKAGRHPIAARHVRHEASIRIDLRVARAQGPFRRGIGDRAAIAGPALEREADHVPGASRGSRRLDDQRRNRIRSDRRP